MSGTDKNGINSYCFSEIKFYAINTYSLVAEGEKSKLNYYVTFKGIFEIDILLLKNKN